MPIDQQHENERYTKERGEMSFFDHINELRKHIMRAALAISVIAVICFLNKDFVFNTIIFGPRSPDFPTFKILCNFSHAVGLGEAVCFTPANFQLITREFGEVIMQVLYVSFWLGVIGAFPFIFWEFWRFISPGLHEYERKSVRGVVAICSALFLLGVLFGYFVIAPFSINFLAGYTLDGVEVAPTLDSYVTYISMFTIPTGFIFQMPVAAYFFARMGLLGTAFLKNYRRHAVVLILILAAIITPPDVISQTLVAIPLYLLFEISIIVVGRVQRKREKALQSEDSRVRKVESEDDEMDS